MQMRILIVEDEAEISRFLRLELKYEGYEIEVASDGRTGLELALNEGFDLILLDVLLPELNGIEVLRRLRREKHTPVIMLTARDTVADKVTGLDTGANDYITKPFHIEELLARIRAITRTGSYEAVDSSVIKIGDLTLDTVQRLVTRNGKNIALTKTQYDLLEYLMRNRNVVITKEQILNKVWGYDFFGDSNVVEVYIRYVRTKIGDTNSDKIIETVRGVGYVIREKA
ncbi:response regulator transcription factor [Cellulosilyticum sp. I15G10I2]|uniref:response regulator transcription factor n=1 Tax=Cellulosilyticum sp. I15G10I2 TaxID=1892843 RepID=UPI00085BE9CB|nr:response regulator transcription factor [Cellulosilyticum sp. I15G10I2]